MMSSDFLDGSSKTTFEGYIHVVEVIVEGEVGTSVLVNLSMDVPMVSLVGSTSLEDLVLNIYAEKDILTITLAANAYVEKS